jgi:signal transduction histidine kinase
MKVGTSDVRMPPSGASLVAGAASRVVLFSRSFPMDLLEHSFLSIFAPDVAQRIADSARVLEPGDGHMVFRQGDEADAVYLVLEGQVTLLAGGSGRGEIVAEVGPDGFFGEFGVLDGEPRSLDARAGKGVRLARLPRRVLLDELGGPEGSPAFRLMVQTVRKMRRLNRRQVDELLQREKMSLLGQLVLGVVHDFRSPLSVVQMAVELMEEGNAEPDIIRESCRLISEQVGLVHAMAEEVLDYSRGSMSLCCEPVDLADLLGRFVEFNGRFMRAKGVRLLLSCHEKLTVRGDAGRLLRIVQNLVCNAVDAMNGQGGIVGIRLERAHDGAVRILVRDNGPGIPEEIRDRMFEPFQSLGSKRGLGLGLAIARQFVEAHGGTLTCATETGRGTAFCISLPPAIEMKDFASIKEHNHAG